MVFETTGAAVAFLLARVLLGGMLAFTGFNHFMQTEQMTGYADMKGVPAPKLSVLLSGGLLVFGGLSVILGFYPVVGAGALAVFLLVTTPKMHDFWNAPADQQQSEMTAFLKNVGLLGGVLLLLALGGVTWPYAVGVGLF
ncbi:MULTISPECIES: DoxX family protein [unclassified Haladaptatus]|uniref:DoxX family protein n=1 Tax=unclassified Haladaptatus TaxID=2622732 RepID=UPI0023E83015|nr:MULTISPECIES: DoxX family protein [unclassified Haladaptatus]